MDQVVLPNYLWCDLLAAALLLMTAVIQVVTIGNRVVLWFNMIWIVVFFLVSTDLIRYHEASARAWLTLFVGLLAVNVGGLLALRPRSEGPDPQSGLGSIALVSRRQLVVLLGIYGVGFAVYLRTISHVFGLHTLLNDPESIRSAAGESYLALVPLWARLAMYLGPLLVALVGVPDAVTVPLPRVVRWVLLVGLAVTMLALLQRTNLFIGLLWLLAVRVTDTRPRVKQRSSGGQRLVAAVLIGVVLFSVFQLLGGALNKTGIQAQRSGNVSPVLTDSGLVSPFLYATSGTAGFLALVDSRNHEPLPTVSAGEAIYGDYDPQTWGGATFSVPLRAVPIIRPFASISPFVDVGVQTNVYTWFEPFYRDFRFVGVALGGAFLGFVITLMHRRRTMSPRVFWLQALFVSTMFFCLFISRVLSTPLITEVVIILWLTRGAATAPERTKPPRSAVAKRGGSGRAVGQAWSTNFSTTHR